MKEIDKPLAENATVGEAVIAVETLAADMAEAQKIVGVDCGNSVEGVAHACVIFNAEQIRYHWRVLGERLQRAHGLIARHVTDLPILPAPAPETETVDPTTEGANG